MTRYAEGLISELKRRQIPHRLAIEKQHSSRLRRLFQKYLTYPIIAFSLRKHQQHIIISERFSYLALFLPKKKTTVICHDLHTLYAEEGNGPQHTIPYRWQIHTMMKRSRPVAVSEHTARDVFRLFPKYRDKEIKVVYDGLESFWFDPIVEGSADFDFPYILAVGTDAWYKNFAFTLKLLKELPLNYRLIKVGQISNDNKRLIQDYELASRIIHKEGIDDDKLKTLYHSAHCLIFPSKSEGFGWPAVEAMACGCPVITSGDGSIREVCQDGVIYARTTEEYAEVVKQLHSETTRSMIKQKAKLRAQFFNWNNTLEGLLK